MNCYRCATPLPDDARFCLSCGADVSGATSGERTQPVEVDPELLARLSAEVAPDYTIDRELGRGGMAAVFLATDVHLGRKIAIKVLPPELTYGHGMVERFKREARTAATLDHPHIIPIFRVSSAGKLFWYAMKYLDGESLATVLEREGHLDPLRAANILSQVAQALDYAHKRGVIHRDVKPANIMLGEEDWVTVTDFGIAKAVDTHSLTGSGSMIGTPYYMSPEQCSGRKVTGASDQYALGVVAYQMLSGHLPFTGQAIFDIVKKHCMDPPPPLVVLVPGLPSRLVTVVERALEKEPDARFPSARAFARGFETAAWGVEPSADEVPPNAARRISETLQMAERPQPISLPVSPPAKRAGRRRWLAVVALTVTAFAVGIGGWLSTRSWPFTGSAGREAASVSDSLASAARPEVTEAGGPPAASERAPVTASPAEGRLLLTGLPPSAVVLVDGRRIADSAVSLTSGSRHPVVVQAAGYLPWRRSVLVRTNETTPFAVRMERAGSVSAATLPGGQRADTPVTTRAEQPAPAPTQLPPAPAGRPPPSTLTVGSRPAAVIYVNGVRQPSYPVRALTVPSGQIHIRFEVSDSGGTWTYDTTLSARPGEHVQPGFVRLRRPQ